MCLSRCSELDAHSQTWIPRGTTSWASGGGEQGRWVSAPAAHSQRAERPDQPAPGQRRISHGFGDDRPYRFDHTKRTIRGSTRTGAAESE